MKKEPLESRFWKYVEKIPFHECWEWVGGKTSEGYGQIWHNDTMLKAHRVSWEIHYGSILKGLLVRHTCDRPSCVNIKHLLLGTNRDNCDDKMKRGRHKCGEGKHNSVKTHCPKGHPYSGKNLYFYVTKTGVNQRVCKICRNKSVSRHYYNNKSNLRKKK